MKMPPAKLEPILRKMQAAGMVREGLSQRKRGGVHFPVWVAVSA